MREAIELAVLREAVGRLPPSFFAAARAPDRGDSARPPPATISSASSASTTPSTASFADAIDRGHAWSVVEAQKTQMDRVRFLSLPGATPVGRLIDQHEAILDAAERGDAAASEAAMRAHLSEVLAALEPLAPALPGPVRAGARRLSSRSRHRSPACEAGNRALGERYNDADPHFTCGNQLGRDGHE